MIKSFADAATARFWESGESSKGWPKKATRRKLAMLEQASELNDLASPPGNRLEKLKGDRQGQYSIRINDQYRLCFNWRDGDAENVAVSKHYE
ncbi:MAG: type II toxin-antitoxin system RelE/ParE family toxin [Acidobacteria bacterium]|nr:type II toxin-antitoxin system RelE/ParE family toxin [Acidobacteriota bacterium]